MRTLAVIAIALALCFGPARDVFSQEEPAPLRVRMASNSNVAAVSFDIRSAFTETFRKKLGGGLTNRVLIEMELFDTKNDSVAVAVRACQLRRDLWDDVLFVGVTDEGQTRRSKFALIDHALEACGVVENVPLVERSLLTRPSGYRLTVRVALNPVSKEVLERTREFMANPRGVGTGGRPRAFFGAVAKLFRSDSAAGGERFIFQSQPLSRP